MIDIHEFKKVFDEIYNEIGHHKVPNTISFVITGSDIKNLVGSPECEDYVWLELDDLEYRFGLEMDTLPGCGCVAGIVVNLKGG